MQYGHHVPVKINRSIQGVPHKVGRLELVGKNVNMLDNFCNVVWLKTLYVWKLSIPEFKRNLVRCTTKYVHIISFNNCSINAFQVFISKSFCQIASLGADDQHKIARIAVNTTCAILPEVLFGLYQEYYLDWLKLWDCQLSDKQNAFELSFQNMYDMQKAKMLPWDSIGEYILYILPMLPFMVIPSFLQSQTTFTPDLF